MKQQFKPIKKYVADFETLSEEHSLKEGMTRVHGWAFCELLKNPTINDVTYTDTVSENMIDDFMVLCSNHPNSDIYFHNLKFDGNFINAFLLASGFIYDDELSKEKTFNCLIDDRGNFYMINVRFEDGICLSPKTGKPLHKTNKETGVKEVKTFQKVVRFLDSLKKIPLPLKSIPKAYGLNIKKLVGDFDYEKPYPIGYKYSDKEIEYLVNDVLIISMALYEDIIENKKGKLTSSADALDDYKERNEVYLNKLNTSKSNNENGRDISNKLKEECFRALFPCLDNLMYNEEETLDQWLRPSYKGGWCYYNCASGTEISDGLVFDVNSLYPSVMYYELLPYGYPKQFDGEWDDLPDDIKEEYPLYIIEGAFNFRIKDGHLPCIQIKGGGSLFRNNEWIKDTNNETVNIKITNIDYMLLKEHYDIFHCHIDGGLAFKGKRGMFKDYIDYWSEVKIQAKKDGNSGLYSLAKRMLNSLYGKFGTNPKGDIKVPYLNENGVVCYTIESGNMRESVYTPIAVFVTSYARNKTIRSAQCNYDRFYYADTDSIHLSGLESPIENELFKIDTYQLGAWKCEMVFHRAKYVRQKTYLESPYLKDGKVLENPSDLDETCIKSDKPEVKCCGLPDGARENVDYDNFIVGAVFTNAKKSPKRVVGGVVLHETDFTIK